MNMFKKNGGFTLVELIVVIAILAILAAVAIPAYSGYISKAEEANDMTLLDSVKTATAFAVMEKNAAAQITKIVVTLSDNGKGGIAAEVMATYVVGEKTETLNVSTQVAELAGQITFKSDNSVATLDNTENSTAKGKWVLSGERVVPVPTTSSTPAPENNGGGNAGE